MANKIHWHPDVSSAIIYWSIALISLFLGFIFSLETASFHWKSLLFLGVFLLFVLGTWQRKLILTKGGLIISYAFFKKKTFVTYEQIDKLQLFENRILILMNDDKKIDLYLSKKMAAKLYEIVQVQVPPNLIVSNWKNKE